MSSWTLGGYPSISQYIVNSYLNNKDIEEIYDDLFKENNRETREIISTFSNAFKHFPFDINTLYFSPIHIAPINIVSKKISNLKATMVTYPFDDISSWTNNLESTINGLNKLLNEWEIGLIRLNKIKTDNKYIKEINIVAEALYLIYSSALNQFKYLGKYISYEEYKSIEKNIVIKFYKLCATNSFIGFEAANQYMLTQNMFLEKIISLIL